ncbi:MAG: DegQ family serine endoprotease [Azospirillaceae bacterium]|nr:DegQ family serine endoprotease [Azospirillaceae bacterium]
MMTVHSHTVHKSLVRRVRGLTAALLLGTSLLTLPVFPGAVPGASAAAIGASTALPGSFADLAEKVTPAVVNIATTIGSKAASSSSDDEEDAGPDLPNFPPGSPFEEFFRRFRDQNGGQPQHHKSMALGSGFIIDPAGYIVTNNHVIDHADSIAVTLQDGTKFDAKLIGRDEKTDLALLKVKSDKPLPFLSFGDSDKTRVGDWILAVGNPFGLGGTVTVGIVSARGRDIHSGPYDDYLQLDASINRGNSGGPTFDVNGQVIGINTAIYSPNGGSVGIGFAIPSTLARSVIDQIRTSGKVSRGWLGVEIQEVTQDIADSLNLSKSQGALVANVSKDSPAEHAGLVKGDVILTFDDKPIATIRDLTRAVADTKAGASVAVEVLRDGHQKTLTVKVETQPAQMETASATNDQDEGDSEPSRSATTNVLGLKLAMLDSATRRTLDVDKSVTGVVVASLGNRDGEVQLQAGDIITKVGDQSVSKPADVARLVKQAQTDGKKAVLMLINRHGSEHFVALSLKGA